MNECKRYDDGVLGITVPPCPSQRQAALLPHQQGDCSPGHGHRRGKHGADHHIGGNPEDEALRWLCGKHLAIGLHLRRRILGALLGVGCSTQAAARCRGAVVGAGIEVGMEGVAAGAGAAATLLRDEQARLQGQVGVWWALDG